MFDSLFSTEINAKLIFIMIGVALACGIVASLINSLKMRSSKGFFLTTALLPPVIASTFIFINTLSDTTSAITGIATVMVGMGVIRFRSANGKAEEMLALFTSVSIGAICGLGYITYACIIALSIPLVFVILYSVNLFSNKKFSREKLLKITIPESLEYHDAFTEIFARYLKEAEQVGVKTTGMGSMFKLSYRIVLKDKNTEKQLIDELRTKNGNLEISILPYVEDNSSL